MPLPPGAAGMGAVGRRDRGDMAGPGGGRGGACELLSLGARGAPEVKPLAAARSRRGTRGLEREAGESAPAGWGGRSVCTSAGSSRPVGTDLLTVAGRGRSAGQEGRQVETGQR